MTRRSGVLPSALALTAYQVLLLLFATGGRLRNLVHWDATWYRDIAAQGYQVALPWVHRPEGGSNIAFFPAFPLWARAVLKGTGASPELAVTLAAQLAAVAAWSYFLLLLRRLRVGQAATLGATVLFLSQPGAFYLVIGYSESLFTASLLGFVYWATRSLETGPRPRGGIPCAALAALHGAVLSGTRVLGVAPAGFPLLLAAFMSLRDRRLDRKAFARGTPIALLALGGFAAFLAYCQLRWGQWDLYWEANRIGWNVYFDPWKILGWSYYRDTFFFGTLSEVFGRLLTALTLASSAGLTLWACRKLHEDPLPLALALLNLGLLLETILGSHGMHSMVRYLVPVHGLAISLGAAWAQERSRLAPFGETPEGLPAWTALLATAGFLLALQILFTIRYSRNDWVS